MPDPELLRRLHHGPEPLLLPNVWDAAGARVVEAAGFPAIATSSGAVAKAHGYEDDDCMPVDVAFGAVAEVARAVSVPVTADIEAGYGLGPDELVERLLAAGAVGCNFEDTDHHGEGTLVDADRQAERIAAVKDAGRRAGVDIVLNARVDVFVLQVGTPDEQLPKMLRRGRLYLEAGADCVYPIGVTDPSVLRALVEGIPGPVNAMLRRGAPSLAELRENRDRPSEHGVGAVRGDDPGTGGGSRAAGGRRGRGAVGEVSDDPSRASSLVLPHVTGG